MTVPTAIGPRRQSLLRCAPRSFPRRPPAYVLPPTSAVFDRTSCRCASTVCRGGSPRRRRRREGTVTSDSNEISSTCCVTMDTAVANHASIAQTFTLRNAEAGP